MAETTSFPFDLSTFPKGQPRLSPYASGPVWLSFGPAAPPYLIPQALIPPSILCNSRHLGNRAASELHGQSTTPFVCVHDVDADVAHTFVHYLHTGEYQTLNSSSPRDHPGGSNEEKSREHRRALLAYVAATVHQLDGLRRLAREKAQAMGQMLPPWVVLHDVESAYEGLRERDDWLDGHMTDAIRKYVSGGNLDRDQQLDKGLKSIFACAILDAVGEVFSHGMGQGGNDSLEMPMAPESVNVEDESEAYCSELSSDAEVIELDPSLNSGSEKTHWLVEDEPGEPAPYSGHGPQSPDAVTASIPESDQMTMLERPSPSASPRAPGSTTNISPSVFPKTRHRPSREPRMVDPERTKTGALPPHIIEIPYRPSPASPPLPPPPPPEIPGVQIVAMEDNRKKNGGSAEPTMTYEGTAWNTQANKAPHEQVEQPPMLPMPPHSPSPQDRNLGFIRWTHPELTESLSKDDKPGIEGSALEKRKYRKKKSTKRPKSSIPPTDCWFPAPPGPHLSHPMPPLGPFPTMRRNFPIKNSPPPPPPLPQAMVEILPPPPPPPQPMTTTSSPAPPPPPPAPVPPPVAYFSYPSDSHMPPPPPPDPQPDNMPIPKLSPNPYKTMLLPPMPPTGPPPPPPPPPPPIIDVSWAGMDVPPPPVSPPNPPSTIASSEMTSDAGGDDHGGATCARMSAHLAGRGWRRCDQCKALVMLATQVARSQQREESDDEDEGETSEDDGEHHGYETSSMMSVP
ncbi:hypothetical protein DIS24_g2602 [Lasiodiplodia hormozganensis]|uniref:BTB domain-containing protein n=1 Tax=Lasiodiplodia hormozganensis TaxID=869390 RepID=A0AA40D4L7_9PEZI|nr:hypothetical protein DIS24_g2602 [Lasiodiplodia hormozganensis]